MAVIAPTTATRVVQLGVETTYGTVVAANKRLRNMVIWGNSKPTVVANRAAGYKHDTDARMDREEYNGKYTGKLDYNAMIYVLASLIKTGVTPTTVGTATKKWVFAGDPTAVDTGQSFSLEHGSSVRAQHVGGVMFKSLTVDFNSPDVAISGDVFGQVMTDGATLSTATLLAGMLAVSKDTKWYIDSTAAALGTTAIAGAIKGQLQVSNRWRPFYTQDRDNPSFDSVVEDEPTFKFHIVVPANAEGMGPLATLRSASDKAFVRAECQGPQTEAGQNYLAQFDMCCYVENPAELKDDNKVVATEYDLVCMFDDTWAKGYSFTIQNLLTAL